MKSYIITGPDNGYYAYNKETASVCSTCGKIDRKYSPMTEFSSLKYDVSCTYDNEIVFSEKVYLELKEKVESTIFKKSGHFYYLRPKRIVAFDHEKRKTRFGKKCASCDSYSSVIGATPCFLNHEINESGIFITDIEFGDLQDFGSTLTPLIIVTQDILKTVLAINPKGLDFEETRC